MSHRGKVAAVLSTVAAIGKFTALGAIMAAIALISSGQLTTAAQQPQQQGGQEQPGRGAGRRGGQGAAPSTARGEGGGMAAQTNGPAGTPIKQNPDVSRPLQNEGMSSNPERYLQVLLGSYGPINFGNDYPNPYKRIEPWGELPANYEGHWPSTNGAEGMPDGNIAVITRCKNNGCKGQPMDPILILNKQGKLIRSFGAGYYDGPHGGTVDKEGNIWTADQNNHLVRKWSEDGKLLLTIGQENVGDPTGKPGILYQPTDVAVDAEGFVYITNSHAKMGPNAFVAKYDKDGKFVKILGRGPTGGNLAGQLDEPHSIAIDIRGRLFIGDRSNNRIQIWDRDGNFITEWRQFSRPSSIYITADDRIVVFDSESWGVDNPGWMKGFRVGNALTGVVSYYAQDIESRDYVHSGPEFGGMDADGNIYACVVRRQQLERHEPPRPIPTRNAAWGPYVQTAGAFPAQVVPYPTPGARGRGRGAGAPQQ